MFGEEITHYALLARANEEEKKMEKVQDKVESGFWSKMQPWQALFALLTYAFGTYGIEDEKALILYGMILVSLGFIMVNSNKHKETIKKFVTPWLVEQLLKTLSEYLAPQLPEPPSEEPITEPIAEPDKEAVIAEVRGAIKALEENMKE